MKVLITPEGWEYILLVADTEEKRIIKAVKRDPAGDNKNADDTRSVHRPFGVTWSKDKLFVANRRNLLVYGEGWKLENVIEDVLDENTHQITWWNDRIISCMTRKDCIQIMKEDGTESEFFHPYKGWVVDPPTLESRREADKNNIDQYEVLHINAVNVVDDVLHILLSGSRKLYNSEIVLLDLKTKKVKNRIFLKMGRAHGLYCDGKERGLMFSRNAVIHWKDQEFSHEVFGEYFTRGIAGDENEIVVGGSPIAARKLRGESYSKLFTINDEGLKEEFVINGYGQINDIRRIDNVDYGHNNPHKFPLSIN